MTIENLQPVKRYAAPLTWLIAAAAIVLTVMPGWPSLVEYDVAAIAHCELWRILTGHLTHWGYGHLFWDVSAFLVLGTICERRSQQSFLACVVGTAAVTSLYMLVRLPEIPAYRGLSGIDTGLFALLGVGIYRDARNSGDRPLQWAITGMAMALLAKLVYEVVTGTTVFVDQHQAEFIPIVAAHILGALVGIVIGISRGHGLSLIAMSSLTQE